MYVLATRNMCVLRKRIQKTYHEFLCRRIFQMNIPNLILTKAAKTSSLHCVPLLYADIPQRNEIIDGIASGAMSDGCHSTDDFKLVTYRRKPRKQAASYVTADRTESDCSSIDKALVLR